MIHEVPVAGEFEKIYDPSVGENERWYINDHTFVRDDTGMWHLIGITDTEPATPFSEFHLAHATAPSLLGPWTKQPYALSVDDSAGETVLWAPHVIRHDGVYWMFVCAGGEPRTAFRIHLATSTDCWTWERHPANPLIVDGWEARDPMVLPIDDRWVMYYTATKDGGRGGVEAPSNHIVAAAESDDLVHWSGRHLVYVDEIVGTGAGPTESPFVVHRNGRYYLFIGPNFKNWNYRETTVLVSDDPLAFDSNNRAATINAHAPEIVVDENGDAWISHCGWGQGGLYLAPLTWKSDGEG